MVARNSPTEGENNLQFKFAYCAEIFKTTPAAARWGRRRRDWRNFYSHGKMENYATVNVIHYATECFYFRSLSRRSRNHNKQFHQIRDKENINSSSKYPC